MYGPSVPGSHPRRSVYVRVLRNDLDPFLTAFDAPVPFTTTGRRDRTNVPAQALIMMNHAMVRTVASDLAAATAGMPDRERVIELWRRMLSRDPQPPETAAALQFVAAARDAYRVRESIPDTTAWIDLAHSLLNTKEFLYVR